jgi:hypothetical protein
LYFRGRHCLSMKMLSRNRLFPSIEIGTMDRRGRSVQAKNVS